MKIIPLIIALITFPLLCFSQQKTVKYFNNKYQTKEVSEQKGKYVLTTTNNEDGSITKELKHLKSGELLLQETLKGDEPYGIWIDKISSPYHGLNYDFNVMYSENTCVNDIPIENEDALKDNANIGYKAPSISGYDNIFHYIGSILKYPTIAKENEIQGKIELSFTVTEEGQITNITINKSVHKHLDKEAVRVIREMEIKEPAKFNNKPTSVCVSLPIKYILG